MVDEDRLNALKTAFTFMPQPVEINRFEYGNDADRILAWVKLVWEVLISHGGDPEAVARGINPTASPTSCY